MKKAKILVVDDEQAVLNGLKIFLTSEGFDVKTVDCGREVLEEAKKFSPDLILMDIMLGDSNGYELKEQLNRNMNTVLMPVIFMSVNNSLDYKRHAYKSGGVDYIVKPFDLEELLIRVESVLTRKKFYENMYMKDTLTGLYNRTHFEKQARILYNLAKRYGKPFSMAVIDIDGLKNINDQHGHEAGNFTIKKTAELIKETIRRMDIATRYGGDEFIVLLPETDSNQVRAFLSRLKKGIRTKDFKYEKGKKILVDINVGSATCVCGEVALEKMFTMADLNMHMEKTRQKKSSTKDILIIEDAVERGREVKVGLESVGFTVKDIVNNFDEAIKYIEKSSGDEPGFVIMELSSDGKLNLDFLFYVYSRWKNTRVYIFTAYIEYLELHPYLRDIVSGVFTKAELPGLIASLKKDG